MFWRSKVSYVQLEEIPVSIVRVMKDFGDVRSKAPPNYQHRGSALFATS